jgi:phosphatidate cytidylyltransferase
MEQAMRNRLTYGPIMLAALFGIFYLDSTAQTYSRNWLPSLPGGVGGIGILLLLLIILPIGVIELATLFTAERVRPYLSISCIGCGLLTIHGFATQFDRFKNIATSSLALIIVFVMLFAALRRAWIKQTQDAILRMAGTVLATLYLGGLAWFIMALRVKHSRNPMHFNGSTSVILMMLLIVKATDIGAYFGGKRFGKHKMIPWLSPGKTWEGLAFGLLTSALLAVVWSRYLNPATYTLAWWKAILFGVIIGGVGQLGDLLESLMKRDAEVKDSGSLVPGFGGILDIIDSPLLAAPFAYLMFSLF